MIILEGLIMLGNRHRFTRLRRGFHSQHRLALETLEQRNLLTVSGVSLDVPVTLLDTAPAAVEWPKPPLEGTTTETQSHTADTSFDFTATVNAESIEGNPQSDILSEGADPTITSDVIPPGPILSNSTTEHSYYFGISTVDATFVTEADDPGSASETSGEGFPSESAVEFPLSTAIGIDPTIPDPAPDPGDEALPPLTEPTIELEPVGVVEDAEPAPAWGPASEPTVEAAPPGAEPIVAPAVPVGGPWNAASVPRVASDPDTNAVELGLKFHPMVTGFITGLRFYKGEANTGLHLAHLWTSEGTLLATAVFTNETGSGWQQVSFPNPVLLSAGHTYVASYSAPNGGYAIDIGYFASGFRTDLLEIPDNAGVFTYDMSGNTAPTETWNSSHYWVDVEFVAAGMSSDPLPADGAPNPPPAGPSQTVHLKTVMLEGDHPEPALAPTAYTATAQSLLWWLDQTYGLSPVAADDDLNRRGHGEKYLQGHLAPSAGGVGSPRYTYYLLPNGDLYQARGSATADLTGVLVAHLDASVYHDPSRLWNATDTAVPVTLSLAEDQLTIRPGQGYEGTFVVVTTLSDGESSLVRPYLVTVYADLTAAPALDPEAMAWSGDELVAASAGSPLAQLATMADSPSLNPMLMTVTPMEPAGSSLFDRALVRWESQMLAYGRQVADEIHADLSESGLGLTYYDSAWVFQKIAAYTGDSSWLASADDALRIYRDTYAAPNQGGIPGHWNFTGGLTADALRTGNSASRDAVFALATNMFGADSLPSSWTETWVASREVAYSLLANLNAEALGAPHRARTDLLVEQALGHLDQWTVSQTAIYVKPFMVALTCEALIAYEARTGDGRVLPAIRTALDWLWAHCWDPSARAFLYASAPTPEEGGVPEAAPDLNLLIAPVFGWVYHQTGDTIYRDRGDAVFAGGVDNAWLSGAKQFNQNYHWSFDYVKWRGEPVLDRGL